MSVDSSISSHPNGYTISATSHGLDRNSSLATTVEPGPSNIGYHSRSNSDWAGLPYLSNDVATIGDYEGSSHRTNDMGSTVSHHARHLGLHDDTEGDFYDDGDEEEDIDQFINFAFLSNLAVQLRDKVPRGTHVKGSIPYPRAFTGKDIVVCIQFSCPCQLRRLNFATYFPSLPSRRKYSESFCSNTVRQQMPDELPYKSPVVSRVNCSFTKSNGVVVFFRTVSRMYTCSWTMMREVRMH